MKLTMCNAHEFKLSKSGKSFVFKNWKNGTYFLFDECKACNEPFFSNVKNAQFCSNECVNNSQKHLYDHVKEFIQRDNYKLLSNTYGGATKKLIVECDKGHEYNVTFNNFKQGYRCPTCHIDSIRHSYDHVKESIDKEGYTLLSDTYTNAHDFLKIRCDKGHEYSAKFNAFLRGRRCPKCKPDSISEKLRHSYDYVKEFIEKEGYTLLSDTYKNNKTKVLLECNNGHKYKVKFEHFRNGVRCPQCNSEKCSSKQEQELSLYVESLGIPIVRNDRTQIVNPLTGHYLELDIWISSMNKAIEYNGTYWHNGLDMIKKDSIKKDQCRKLGIDLLVVNEYNWTNNQEVEMIKIKNWIGDYEGNISKTY